MLNIPSPFGPAEKDGVNDYAAADRVPQRALPTPKVPIAHAVAVMRCEEVELNTEGAYVLPMNRLSR